MSAYLSSMGMKVWSSVQYGYEASMIEDATTKLSRLKKDSEWDVIDRNNFEANSVAINALYCALSMSEFHRVSSYTTDKEVWDILQITHEGTKTVKTSKIQMLTTRFEELRMLENESFDSFITNLSEIMTSFHSLGDPLSNLKICRKILRSLPERFSAKVVAIEERPEVDEISFEELDRKLQTFKLNHLSNKTPSKPNKGIAFKSSQVEP